MEAAPRVLAVARRAEDRLRQHVDRRAGAAVGVRDATGRPTRRSASTTRASSSRRRSRSICAPGVSLSQATRAVDDALARIGVPNTVHGSFQGSARAFQASLDSQPWLILAALSPSTSCSACSTRATCIRSRSCRRCRRPASARCSRCMLFRTEFTIIAFIGVILLIGIVKKNAIMMIDFALEAERARGLVHARCDLRGLPAALPADHDDDDGRDARRAAAGAGRGRRRRDAAPARHRDRRRALLVSQLLTLYTTPVVYLYLDRFRLWATRARARRAHVPQAMAHAR